MPFFQADTLESYDEAGRDAPCASRQSILAGPLAHLVDFPQSNRMDAPSDLVSFQPALLFE